ncbi:MAG: hypothetical protein KAI57_03795 [Candidatus Pacebacteria bacterium]|nr:hypothetical protein [Candidatus Paceibacterota bacterium]
MKGTARIVIDRDVLGIEQNGKFRPAEGLISHVAEDIDNEAARWLLDLFGINYGRVKYVSVGEGGLVDRKKPIEHLEAGWILLDVGGAGEKCNIDNLIHLDHDHSAKNTRCSTTIVFDLIFSSGYSMEPAKKEALLKILKFVENRDLRGGQQFFDLAHLVKELNTKITENKLYKRVKDALDFYLDNFGKQPNVELFEKLVLEVFAEKHIFYDDLDSKEPLKRYLR